MPRQQTDTIMGLNAPVSYGDVTLVNGQAVEVVNGDHDPGAAQILSSVMLTRRTLGSNPGVLTYVWDPSTSKLTVDSDNALDDGVVRYLINGR